MSTRPEIVLFSTDLMLISSVSGAASAAGLLFSSVSVVSELSEKASSQACIVCLDLNGPHGDPMSLRDSLPTEVLAQSIAFGPHVHKERLDRAKRAGFGRVMSRGQFVASMRQEFLIASTQR